MSPSTVVSHEITSIQIPLPNITTSSTTDSSREPTTGTFRNKIKSSKKSWTYQGYSRAGTATSFVLVEPKWIFDCGCLLSNHTSPSLRPTCIFITHTHADHIQTLHQILFSQKPILPTKVGTNATSAIASTTINANTIHVYFPAAVESLLRNFLQSYYELIRDTTTTTSNCSDADINSNELEDMDLTMEQAYNFQLHPIQVHDEFTVPAASCVSNKDVKYVVRIVQCCHRKVCIGYSIFQRERILIEPFCSMTGIELGNYIKEAKLKNKCTTGNNSSNISNISNMKEWSPILQPIICFLGDTTTRVFTLHPEILQQHRYIAMECTYYYGTIDDEYNNNIHQHTFWDVLRTNVLQKHPNILFLLQHFSLRHRQHEWMNWMYDYTQSSSYYNVHPMLIQSSSAQLNPSSNNKVSYTLDVTEDVSVIQCLSMNQESISSLVILSCNCFLCQPK